MIITHIKTNKEEDIDAFPYERRQLKRKKYHATGAG